MQKKKPSVRIIRVVSSILPSEKVKIARIRKMKNGRYECLGFKPQPVTPRHD